MVDWSGLEDAYGDASDIPALLARAEETTDWASSVWEELWQRLCHQGSVPPAGYAAVPFLADMAVRRVDVPVEPALHLLAAILATTDESDGVRRRHQAALAAVRPVARAKLDLASTDTELVHGLQAVAAVEDLEPWHRELEGLTDGELEIDCPECGDGVVLVVQEDTLLVTSGPTSTEGAAVVVAASAEQLSAAEVELVRLADARGRQRVSGLLSALFSAFDCPHCGAHTSVAEAVTS